MVRLVEGDAAVAEKERQRQTANLKRWLEMNRVERRRAGLRLRRRVLEAWLRELEDEEPS